MGFEYKLQLLLFYSSSLIVLVRVFSSNTPFDDYGVIIAILLIRCSYIYTAKKLLIYLSAGTIFSKKVTWRIISLSALQSS